MCTNSADIVAVTVLPACDNIVIHSSIVFANHQCGMHDCSLSSSPRRQCLFSCAQYTETVAHGSFVDCPGYQLDCLRLTEYTRLVQGTLISALHHICAPAHRGGDVATAYVLDRYCSLVEPAAGDHDLVFNSVY